MQDTLDELFLDLGSRCVVSSFNVKVNITKDLLNGVHDCTHRRIIITHLTILTDSLLTTKFREELVSTDLTIVSVIASDT
jgi:hypothetical protein